MLTSTDGTKIAHSVVGEGPPVILVDGAMCYRASGPSGPLAAELAADYMVYTYDRRGRGESAVGEYSVEREVEDLAALVKEAGGAAHLVGQSSGAMLALEAANQGVGAVKLAMYEPPLIVDDTHAPAAADALPVMQAQIAAGRRGDAVKTFMRSVDVPAVGLLMMRMLPVWKTLKGVAHTLPNDLALVEGLRGGHPLPTSRWTLSVPTLVADGGKSPEYMRNSSRAMATVLPNATYRTLPGQTHLVKPAPLAAALREFLAS